MKPFRHGTQTEKPGRFDAALEEVWHVVTHSGYAVLYPTVFGEGAETSLSNAMDIARGGRFTTIPQSLSLWSLV